MENKELHQQFRRTIEKSAWMMVFLIFLIESIVAVFAIYQNMVIEDDSPLSYSLAYIVLPTLINMECVLIFHYIEYKTNFLEHTKNCALIIVFNILCLTTALVHNAMHMICLSFILPVFLSAIFGDKKLTRFTFIMAFISYLTAMVNGIYYATDRSPMAYLDYFSGIVLMGAGYLVARSVIKYEQKKNHLLLDYNYRQQEMIEEMKKDSLTRLYNHNTLYDILNDKIKKTLGGHNTLALAILDIDNFKKINDTYGHVKGDQVLISLSDLLRARKTEQMLLARYGGEEFCILFIDMDIKDAYGTLEKMRLEFSHLIIREIDDTRITFSAGLVEFTDAADNGTAFVEKADQAMYKAKRDGKNKISVYESNETSE